MKRLFGVLVLLIGMNVYGQERPTFIPCKDEWVQIDKYEWENCALLSYVDSSAYYRNIEVLLYTYDEYAEECYNDSSLIIYNTYSYYLCEDPNCITYHAYYLDDDYTHTEPSFSGFMNWLKAKICSEKRKIPNYWNLSEMRSKNSKNKPKKLKVI